MGTENLIDVQDALLDLGGASLIPELTSKISASPPHDIHLRLIGVAALGTPPDEFAVRVFDDFDLAIEPARLAVVRLRVQLGIHDVVVDELHDGGHRFQILLKVGDFHIRDRTAGREQLELRLDYTISNLSRHIRDASDSTDVQHISWTDWISLSDTRQASVNYSLPEKPQCQPIGVFYCNR